MGRKPTDVFSEWAKQGRDEGMAKGHKSAVNQMLSIALKGRDKFSFIDAFPISLQGLDFEIASGSTEYMQGVAMFKYSYYEIEIFGT